jgi:pyridoxine 4-dehydrogenase
VALAWALAHSHAMLPIPGTSKLPHLDENIDAAFIELSKDEIARLESAAAPA